MDQNQALNNLVERAKHGDDAAFAELYTSAYRTVYVTCNGYLKHPQEAEDVTQEVFIQIYHKLNTLENNLTFYGWAKTIAMHLSLNRIRDNRDHASFDDAIANNEINEGDDNIEMLPDTYILKEEKRKILEKIIETELTDVQYQTIFMHYFNEVPVENIAQIMECPEGTVKTRLKSARVKIKAAIEKYEQTTGDRLIVANAIPSIAMILKMSAASVPVQVAPFAGFAGVGTGVGSAVAKGAQTAAKGAKATGKASKASKAGKAATAAGGVAAKGLIAKVVGSIVAVAVVGVGTVAIAQLVNDNKEEEESVETTEAVVEEPSIKYYSIGSYELDGDKSNGLESIEWIVLDETDTDMLLISKTAIDSKVFNAETDDTNWGDSLLRKILNDDFFYTVFTPEEQGMIMTSVVKAETNPSSKINPGIDTTDRVYLLSVNEVNKYFEDDASRVCLKSDAVGGGECSWWLRTPGASGNRVAYVNVDGSIMEDGNFTNRGDVYVRPVIRVSKGEFSLNGSESIESMPTPTEVEMTIINGRECPVPLFNESVDLILCDTVFLDFNGESHPYHVPNLQYDTADAKRVNGEVADILKRVQDDYTSKADYGAIDCLYYRSDMICYIYNQYVSVIIRLSGWNYDTEVNYIWTIDTTDGTLVSDEELLKISNCSYTSVYEAITSIKVDFENVLYDEGDGIPLIINGEFNPEHKAYNYAFGDPGAGPSSITRIGIDSKGDLIVSDGIVMRNSGIALFNSNSVDLTVFFNNEKSLEP